MPIEGPLRELALSDVLQLLDLSRKTGRLAVRPETREDPVELFLDQGAIVGVRGGARTLRIGELLVLAGKATESQVGAAVASQARSNGRLLGSLLVDEAGVPEGEVRRQLRFQVEEVVYDVVRWTDGYFHFEEGTAPRPELSIRIPTESLLMEAVRRVDEWEALGGAADAELVPVLVDQPAAGSVLELEPGEWEVLAVIDGQRTLRAIAKEVGRAEFEVAKAVFGLVDAGVVEVGARRASAPAAPAAPAAPSVAEARLVSGREEAARGRWSTAAEVLEEAVAADPLLAEAYRWLGVCRARLGALQEAEEALRTYLRLDGAVGSWRGEAERGLRAIRELREWLIEESDEPAR